MATLRTDVAPLAQQLAQYLITVQRAHNVRITELTGAPARELSFTLAFTWRDQERTFRYVIRRDDDPERVFKTLRVETQGELLVQQPGFEAGPRHLSPNVIYYPVRA
ncbi:MAG: hypothetical protein NVSMB65_07230 [Chloroflexota bacterium]